MDKKTTQKRDPFCWVCAKKNVKIPCTNCCRSVHKRCLQNRNVGNWTCDECLNEANVDDLK